MNNIARYLFSLGKSEKTLSNTFSLVPITAFPELEQNRVLVVSCSSALRKHHFSAQLLSSRNKKSPAISRSKANMCLYCLHSANFHLPSIKKKEKRTSHSH